MKHLFTLEDLGITPESELTWRYKQDFLTPREANDLYARVLAEPWKPHRPDITPGLGRVDAFSVFYGAVTQQVYRNPDEIRKGPPFPEFLTELLKKVEDQAEHTFNFVEAHKFENTVRVRPHHDPPGCVAMVTLGHERVFRVGGRITGKFDSRVHHDFEERLLHHGSLLTFLGKVAHSMEPTDEKDGGRPHITLVFRYSTEALQTARDGKARIRARSKHTEQYEEAQAKWKKERKG